MFVPVTETSTVPILGTSIEHLAVDFKRSLDPDLGELAKDVAAFANSVGGVIWVGVDEDRATRTVGRYHPVADQPAADHIRVQYQEAADKLCSPSPLVDTMFLPVAGGFVVAVNVWPFPGQAVGVRVRGDAYKFPIRIGTQTGYLKAEQLPMLMLPDQRRTAILLGAVPRGGAVVLSDQAAHRLPLEFDEVRLMENVASFKRQPDRNGNPIRGIDVPCIVPIDLIVSVWRGSDAWQVVTRYNWTFADNGGLRFSVT